MPLLGVNIDHVATLRQARYRAAPVPPAPEPDPVQAIFAAVAGGADILTLHLREDRRHVQDRDLRLACELSPARVNLEMGATDEMVKIARDLRVPMVTLVPEGRQEVTTEGGLDVAGQAARLKDVLRALRDRSAARASEGASGDPGVTISAFIDADPRQVEAARASGFDACELHTGPYAAAFARAGGDPRLGTLASELHRLTDAAHRVRALGLRLNAGHALNYLNVGPVARLAGMSELHIGHAIVARAVFVGLEQAVREMKRLTR